MKILKELTIILFITFLGETLSKTLSLPLPGTVVGMLLLLACLITKIIKVDSLKITSNYMLDNLAFFFLPAGVGIISSLNILSGNTLKILTVIIASTLVVTVVTGLTVQGLIILQKKLTKASENK
jgi:holin-like protein